MVHVPLTSMLQVVFQRGVCLVLSSLLSILMIYLKFFIVVLPFLQTTPMELYRPMVTSDDSNILDIVWSWSSCWFWQMEFNYTKCKHLSLAWILQLGSTLWAPYWITSDWYQWWRKWPGTFSRDFKFRSHIHTIARKANKALGVINCSFKYLYPNITCLLHSY